MIVADPYNAQGTELATFLKEEVPELEADGDLVVAIGGDGFMLHTIQRVGLQPTFLGLNAGRIGFLMNDVNGKRDKVIELLKKRAWSVTEFPLLDGQFDRASGEPLTVKAINDVVLERDGGQTSHLRIRVDDHVVVDRLVADGVIFSTALGSTAYAFSAGGPAIHPTLRAMQITPICPHHPRLSPILLPEGVVAEVSMLDAHRRPVRALADGTNYHQVVSATIRMSDERVRIAWLSGHDFTGKMVQKILRP